MLPSGKEGYGALELVGTVTVDAAMPEGSIVKVEGAKTGDVIFVITDVIRSPIGSRRDVVEQVVSSQG